MTTKNEITQVCVKLNIQTGCHINVFETAFVKPATSIMAQITTPTECLELISEFLSKQLEFLIKKHKLKTKIREYDIYNITRQFIIHMVNEQTLLQEQQFKDVYKDNLLNKLINQYEKDTVTLVKSVYSLNKEQGIGYYFPILFETSKKSFNNVLICITTPALKNALILLDKIKESAKKGDDSIVDKFLAGLA